MNANMKKEGGPVSLFVSAAEALIRLGGVLATLMILGVLCVVSYAILQRYVLDTPLLWGDQLIGYVLVAIVMLGAADALRRGDHISIDLLAARAGRRGKTAVSILGNLAVAGFAGVIGWSCWHSIQFAYSFGSYSVGYIEVATWIPQVPILIGAVLLFLAAASGIARALTGDTAE
jgi:TRAP-type C4-dicarboxylate transport system permease small subunit